MNKVTLIIILAITVLIGTTVAITNKKSKEMTIKQRILKTMYPMVMRISKKEKQPRYLIGMDHWRNSNFSQMKTTSALVQT